MTTTLRYIIWYLISLVHILVILIVIIGPFLRWQCLVLHPLIHIQWKLLNNQCVFTHIENWVYTLKDIHYLGGYAGGLKLSSGVIFFFTFHSAITEILHLTRSFAEGLAINVTRHQRVWHSYYRV